MRKIILLLMLLLGSLGMSAQEGYDPANPAEPYARYKLTVKATPEGYTSGGGKYLLGEVVNVRTSASSQNYTFSHWTKNGTYLTDQQNFSYTITSEIVVLEAVYEFTPPDPAEPEATNQWHLYLTNNIQEACSFNRTSGAKAEAGQTVYVRAYPNSGYDFVGWFCGSEKVSSDLAFNYQMPSASTTLTAQFEYNPWNPDDPEGSGEDVENTKPGDVNRDGEVTITDVGMMIDYILGKNPDNFYFTAADVNSDNAVTITDVGLVIDIILTQ